MLPAATERILATLGPDDLLLDVGGWGAPFNRATHILDAMPFQTRGVMGSYGPPPERFSPESWVQRDFCDREPWPWPDDHFDFSLCVTTLEDIRDPIWVCSELSRVSKAGYVEVPTVIDELVYGGGGGPWLGHEHHRWLCFIDADAQRIEFLHKPHSLHDNWRVRVLPRWAAEMGLDDQLQGLFWEGTLDASERVVVGPYPHAELERMVRERFPRSEREWRMRELAASARGVGARAKAPVRRVAERLISRS